MTRRLWFPVLIALSAAVMSAASACTVLVPGTAVSLRVERRGPAGVVPPGLERFYGQPLAWGRCETYATDMAGQRMLGGSRQECARLVVPLDYAKPGERTITLGLLRLKAAAPDRRIGSLLVNPGGPGESGMVAAASLAGRIRGTELGDRFDLVGFDPRGVGASEPALRCLTDQEKDAERLEFHDHVTADDVPRIEAERQDLARKCADRSGTDLLANVGSRDVARDMDVLRSALGDAKLTYLGYSYGTRIGTAYAEAFPGNVRALVLDGAIDPAQDEVSQAVGQANGFKNAFESFAEWCVRNNHAECVLGTDTERAEERLDGLLDGLKKQPMDVQGRKLSYSDAAIAVIQGLYSDQLWEILHDALKHFRDGDGESLLRLADLYQGRGADGKYSTAQDALIAIRCVDDPRITDRAVVAEMNRRVAESEGGPLVDDGTESVPALDVCAFWPVPPTSQPHLPQVRGLPPTLVISTTGDPATPYQAGVNLAKALGGGLLTYEAVQHTAFLQGDKCVDDAGTAYLVDLKLPAEGTRCS